MNWHPYPRLPHIEFRDAGTHIEVRNTQTGETRRVLGSGDVHAFAADQTRGLGTTIHRVTSKFGIKRCTPCARRQAMLNALTKRQ